MKSKTLFRFALTLIGVFGAIAVQAQLTVTGTATQVACNNDGAAVCTVVGGVAPYTFNWQHVSMGTISTNQNPTNLVPGWYYLQVTDVTGTTAWDYVSINSTFSSSGTSSPSNCPLNDGWAAVQITGGIPPYTYAWSTGVINTHSNINDTLHNLGQGTYDCTITDATGCIYTTAYDSSLYVWENSNILAAVSTTPSNCFDGTATVNITAGTAPFVIDWQHYDSNTQTWTYIGNGTSANNLQVGSIQCTVTDVDGCSSTFWGYVNPGPNYITSSVNVTPSLCPLNNGAIDLTVSGGTPPYTYLWSNGATTEDISGLSGGTYSVVITDNAGCSVTRYKYVNEASPVVANVSTTQTTCWSATGTATATVTGGTAPYTYQWGNGSTANTAATLPMGYIGVSVVDANGCVDTDYDYVDQPFNCYGFIEGVYINDLNGDCQQGLGDSPLYQWALFDMGNNQYQSAAVGPTGQYSLTTVPGPYNVMVIPPAGWTVACPATPYSLTTTAGNTDTGNDFFLQPDSIFKDLRVNISCGPARPGFNQQVWLTVHNDGSFMAGGDLNFTHDPQLTWINNATWGSTYSGGTATWSTGSLFPGESRTFQVTLGVPASLPIGTPTQHTTSYTPLTNDVLTLNNFDTCDRLVTGSYDPNIKEVMPRGEGAPGYISHNDSLLEYTIHFQNTGNDTAFTVAVVDTIDPSLDLSTFEVHAYSHDMRYEINGRTVTFIFENILLPDSTTNEPESHGTVQFSIKQMPGLPLGTEIKNKVYIYFDYNLPIITNETLNTLAEPDGIEEVQDGNGMLVYPNPFNQQLTLEFISPSTSNGELLVVDLTGKVIHQEQLNNLYEGAIVRKDLTLNGIASGIYFLQLRTDSGTMTQRIIKH